MKRSLFWVAVLGLKSVAKFEAFLLDATVISLCAINLWYENDVTLDSATKDTLPVSLFNPRTGPRAMQCPNIYRNTGAFDAFEQWC